MTIRVYLMPRIGDGLTLETGFKAKYSDLLIGTRRSCLRYGPEPVCLFIANTDATQHAALIANTDVRAFPDNLDSNVTSGNRAAIVNALELANVPAQWVANGQTFRTVLLRLAGIFQLLQNVDGRGFRFLQQALDNQINTLPQSVRDGMQSAATTLGLTTTGITGTTTLRVALANIGAQFETRSFTRCGVTF